MTLTVHSMQDNCLKTVTLTDYEVAEFEQDYIVLSTTMRKKFPTLESFIRFVLSFNI